MLLTITSINEPATDLGYLLHKNPARAQRFALSFGEAHFFYSEADSARCTAVLMLDIDPVRLVRGRQGPDGYGGLFEQYVNDRPYVASSFLSVAIAQVLRNALQGRCREKPELAEQRQQWQVKLTALPCRGGEPFLRRLFEPLGYKIEVTRFPLDQHYPEWGDSGYFNIELKNNCLLSELLSHIYVLVPVLDNEKHYWIGEDEVEKLLRHGEGWLATHPEREVITRRYLKHRGGLVRMALARLLEGENDPDKIVEQYAEQEATLEKRISLNEERLQVVVTKLKELGVRRVIDLGCGEGKLIKELLTVKDFTEIVGLDVSHRALEIAEERLHLERLPAKQQERVKLLQGSLTYRDRRLQGYDAACVIEVIEHLDLPRLMAFERVLFESARPRIVIVTTPNIEYNVKFVGLPAGKLRNRDHRFEWTRQQFQDWANNIAARFNYEVSFAGIGPADEQLGAPTQMAIFQQSEKE